MKNIEAVTLRIVNGLEAASNRFHDLGDQAEADRCRIGERYAANKDTGMDFSSASRNARLWFVRAVLTDAAD